jgi:hypothetical protein
MNEVNENTQVADPGVATPGSPQARKQAAIDTAANIYHSLPEGQRLVHLANHKLVTGYIDPEGDQTVFATTAYHALQAIYNDLDDATAAGFADEFRGLLNYIQPTDNA